MAGIGSCFKTVNIILTFINLCPQIICAREVRRGFMKANKRRGGALLPAVFEEKWGSGSADEFEQLCRHMRLMSGRDVDRTVARVFRVMVARGRMESIGGTELAEISRLNRITCLHHLGRLEAAGVVEREGRRYRLSEGSVEGIVEAMRAQTLRMFEEIEELARSIDEEFEGIGGSEAYGRKKIRSRSARR